MAETETEQTEIVVKPGGYDRKPFTMTQAEIDEMVAKAFGPVTRRADPYTEEGKW